MKDSDILIKALEIEQAKELAPKINAGCLFINEFIKSDLNKGIIKSKYGRELSHNTMMKEQDVFVLHEKYQGKIEITPTIKITNKEILSLVYTPHVGRVSEAIHKDPSLVKKYTIAGKMVAVISDGSAVLGIGNVGAKAALPVMEGKCAIFKEFANVDAFPLCLDTQDPDEIIETIQRVAPNFAAINMEDIAAPACFYIEEQLNKKLDIPVMHDDQHGTAIVVLAALKAALMLQKKKNLTILILGAGAAGIAIAKLLLHVKKDLHISEIKLVDSRGLISTDRKDMNVYKEEIAEKTNQKYSQTFDEAIKGVDIFIGVSRANLLSKEHIKSMNTDPVIFALANPTPEIMPEEAKKAGADIVATGRSDFPNQINNALVYPGVFKGLIFNQINKVTTEIKVAAADAIFQYHKNKITKDNLLPSILDKKVPEVIYLSIQALKKK